MTEKKMIRVYGASIYYSCLEGSIDNAIKAFQDLKNKGYEYLQDEENVYGETIGLSPYYFREETKDEYQKRIQGDKVREGKEKKRRMQQYEQLKREFGDA